MKTSIPLDVLIRIEEERPELAPMIHDLMAVDGEDAARVLEKRLAGAYFSSGHSHRLSDEEQLRLLACCSGGRYGESNKNSLH